MKEWPRCVNCVTIRVTRRGVLGIRLLDGLAVNVNNADRGSIAHHARPDRLICYLKRRVMRRKNTFVPRNPGVPPRCICLGEEDCESTHVNPSPATHATAHDFSK